MCFLRARACLAGFGCALLQVFSVFDWRLMYRVPVTCVPFGRRRPSAVTALLPLRLRGLSALVVGHHDGCFSVWTREGFGSLRCEQVVVAHSDSIGALVDSGGQVITGEWHCAARPASPINVHVQSRVGRAVSCLSVSAAAFEASCVLACV